MNDATPVDSVDKLQKVMLKYPERKNNIKIIHHALNRGSAASRNTALEGSTGTYISVVDSDDYIDPEIIEIQYNKAVIENADIVICDFSIEYPDRTKNIYEIVSEYKVENFKNMIQHDLIYSSLWNKLVKRTL